MGASFQLSPGVVVREVDLTAIVPQVATSSAAYVGSFQWGPVDEIKTISSEEIFNNMFGTPDADTYLHYFSVKNFLDYSNNIKVVRVIEDTALNAAANGTGILVKNDSDWLDNHSAGGNLVGEFAARYPGALGNNIKVEMADSHSYSSIVGTTLTAAGSGYTTAADNNVPVVFSDPPAGGVTATGTLIVAADAVTGILITESGSGYKTAPTISIPTPVGGGTGATATANLWAYRGQFLSEPGTSDYVAAKGGANDELHIIVIDETGVITGEAGTVLERFPFVSKASDARNDDGTSAYYVDTIRDASKYIHFMDHLGLDWGGVSTTDFDLTEEIYSASFSGGISGNVVTNDELMPGWMMFQDADVVDVSILIAGAADATLAQFLIQNIAETRKDCVAVISPLFADAVRNAGSEMDDIITMRDGMTSSSYGIFDCNWKYQFDSYNNTFRWLPCNADVAGLMARTDLTNDPWWSPAGFNRGQIKNVVKLAWNPTKTERDELYQKGINPIVVIAGEGTILFGDKTMLAKPSAFDRINVRRLFIVLEKAIARAAKYSLFEFNDEFTRARFQQMIEPYLRDVQGRRGITDFRVVCDETNNTPQVIDSNGFVGDIYIKPNRSINFITLNFIATPTGVDFSEVQGAI
jgi:hypothetical protein